MPRIVNEFRVFLSSPGDLKERREGLRKVLSDWNAAEGVARSVRLEPVLWESHATPMYGKAPQTVIDAVLDECDFGIAVFWTRFGTPTEHALSGTSGEMDRLMEQGKAVLPYVCNELVDPSRLDPSQLASLQDYLGKLRRLALLREKKDWDSLFNDLRGDLTRTVDTLQLGTRLETSSRIEEATDPTAIYNWAASAFADATEVFDVTLGRQPLPYQRVPEEEDAIQQYRDTREAFLQRHDVKGYYELIGYDAESGDARGRYERIRETTLAAQRRQAERKDAGKRSAQRIWLLPDISGNSPTVDFFATDRHVVLLQIPIRSSTQEYRYRYVRIESPGIAAAYRGYFDLLADSGREIRVEDGIVETSPRGARSFTPLRMPSEPPR